MSLKDEYFAVVTPFGISWHEDEDFARRSALVTSRRCQKTFVVDVRRVDRGTEDVTELKAVYFDGALDKSVAPEYLKEGLYGLLGIHTPLYTMRDGKVDVDGLYTALVMVHHNAFGQQAEVEKQMREGGEA